MQERYSICNPIVHYLCCIGLVIFIINRLYFEGASFKEGRESKEAMNFEAVTEEYREVTALDNADPITLVKTEALKIEAVENREEQNKEIDRLGKVECLVNVRAEAKKKQQAERAAKFQVMDSELDILLKIVEAEAGGEGLEGKKLVANVILNRVASEKFPNTVREVVFQTEGGKVQFSPIADGRYEKIRVSDETRKAVEAVLAGEDSSQGALFFSARKKANPESMKWFDQELNWLFQYGNHEFYKYK